MYLFLYTSLPSFSPENGIKIDPPFARRFSNYYFETGVKIVSVKIGCKVCVRLQRAFSNAS